jgi:hypothetical protein
MDPPTPTTTKKIKENARKAAQKKAKKEAKKKAHSTFSQPDHSGSSPAAVPVSGVPPSYLSSFSASTTPTPPLSTTTDLPAALLGEAIASDDPSWLRSAKKAWTQGQKNVCIRWVREKRELLARAEDDLAAGRGSDEEVEVSNSFQLTLHAASIRTNRYGSGGDEVPVLSH